jgi:prepilin-type N-terminal cleavage/methylation domain-containing protein
MSQRPAGHTLLEMLVVIAVVATATALVGPHLGMSGRTRLEAVAHELSDRLQAARQEAVLSGRAVRVALDRLPPDVRVVAVRVAGRRSDDHDGLTVDPVSDPRPRQILIEDAGGRRAGVTLPPGFAPPTVDREPHS